MVTVDELWDMVIALPGTERSVSYGTPSFKVGGEFMGRIMEDGKTISLSISKNDREMWVAAAPEVYSVPDHFKEYDYVVIDLENANKDELKELLENAWERRAPRSLRK